MRVIREAAKKEFLDIPSQLFTYHRAGRRSLDLLTPIGNFLTPALPRAFITQARNDAQIRIARTALALSLYKSEVRSYPDSPDAIVPDYLPQIQLDPFDGKPLRYKRKDGGYILYSVDVNRIDDGGIITDKYGTGDLVSTMAR